jgi:putative PIN family toxin of toxin-antitoxin system
VVRVVLDTSVIIAAWRSRTGASSALLGLLPARRFEIAVSVPLVLEYEAVLLRHVAVGGRAPKDVAALVDYLCAVAKKQEIFFLWRPFLRDPDDDMLVELAVAAGCDGIVTHNVHDFGGVDSLGLRVFTPAEFLVMIGGTR